MVANLKTMDEAGIQQMPATIDEFVTALRAVKRAKPASSPMGLTTKGAVAISVPSSDRFQPLGIGFEQRPFHPWL
jgi:hypothetical protein